MTDLVTRLQEAASAAIVNEAPALSHHPETIRGLTLELTITSAGQVHEAVVCVERRTQGGALPASISEPTSGLAMMTHRVAALRAPAPEEAQQEAAEQPEQQANRKHHEAGERALGTAATVAASTSRVVVDHVVVDLRRCIVARPRGAA